MVVVTGAPRSGTSLMMRTIMGCGYHVRPGTMPIVYEHRDMFLTNATSSEDKEEVIKILGGNINNLALLENVEAVIFCIRNPMDSFLSWMRWNAPVRISGHLDRKYLDHYQGLDKFVFNNPKIPTVVVDFDDWKKDAAAVTKKLAGILGVSSVESLWSPGNNEMESSKVPKDISKDSYHMRVKDETRIKEIIKISKKLKKKR